MRHVAYARLHLHQRSPKQRIFPVLSHGALMFLVPEVAGVEQTKQPSGSLSRDSHHLDRLRGRGSRRFSDSRIPIRLKHKMSLPQCNHQHHLLYAVLSGNHQSGHPCPTRPFLLVAQTYGSPRSEGLKLESFLTIPASSQESHGLHQNPIFLDSLGNGCCRERLWRYSRVEVYPHSGRFCPNKSATSTWYPRHR